MADNMHMIVVLISEGKSFPKRSSHQLVFEARFDGELLSTDGVNHGEAPEITQELAWQISKKSLQQHKLQRTPIKILCYALDTRSSAREQIGYIVLDLRSAPDKPVKKWYQLLNTKYKKSKPQLKVAVYLEPLMEPWNQEVSKHSVQNAETSLVDVTQLKPELNDVDGVFQLGPADRCREVFVFSITVAFAAHLASLLPNRRNVSIDTDGFYFFYTLFDNDVMTEKFLDLLDPKLTAERASVRLRTSLIVLRHYLNSLPPLQFHLCTGDTSLGCASVKLDSLLSNTDELKSTSTCEGAFELQVPSKFKSDESPALLRDEKPIVGVSIQLRRETPVSTAQGDSGMCLTDRPASADPAKSKPQAKSPADTADDYSNTFETENSSVHSPPPKSKKQDSRPAVKQRSLPPSPSKGRQSPTSLTTTSEHTQLINQPHHYEFTLQLKTISNISTDHHIFVYLRYRYPAFGSVAPFTTHPAIEVRRDCEYSLSNSLCTMDFSMTLGDLKNTVMQNPFEVELWQYDQMAGNKCLGRARLPLHELFSAKQISVQLHDKPANQYNITMSTDVCDSNSRRIAELSARLSLSDFGEVPAQLVVEREPSSQSKTDTGEAVHHSPNPTETAEYKAALELEMWKDAQEKLFESQIKEKEGRLIAKLTDDFKRRDMERELLCKKKVAENNSMQQELQKMINQLTKRENAVTKKEQEIERTEADLRHAYDRKLLDLKESSRRLEQECEHRLSLAKSRIEDNQQQILKLKQDLDQAAVKYQGLENEFAQYKEQQHNKPEIKLQSEINLLTLEKVELERRLEACNKSKAHYKQQWGRALKENAKLKEASDEEAKRFAQSQIKELEMMKQRLFASEERDIIKSEKKELAGIKEELSRQQKESNENTNPNANPAAPEQSLSTKHNVSRVTPALEEQLTRLQEERDSLLRTGVFNTDDDMILELERRIRAIIQSIDNNQL